MIYLIELCQTAIHDTATVVANSLGNILCLHASQTGNIVIWERIVIMLDE